MPAFIAAILFAIAFLGTVNVVHVNVEAWTTGGLFFLALTPMVIFNRGASS